MVECNARIMKAILEGRSFDSEDARILSDLRDYFIYSMLKASREEASSLIDIYNHLATYALSQLLQLRYFIAKPLSEGRSYDEWHQSFKQTLKHLDLQIPQDKDT